MERMPIFIKVENYEDVLDVMNMIREKLEEIKTKFTEIEQLKAEEDTKINDWHKNIEEIEGRMQNMSNIMFEPEQ